MYDCLFIFICSPVPIMNQEKYSLTWHTYSDYLKSMMKELMVNEDYSDVTLVTEDKQALRSSCELLRTKDSKRFYKEPSGTFRMHAGYCNCMQATVTACKLL